MTIGLHLRRARRVAVGALVSFGFVAGAASANEVTLRAGTFLPPADTFWYPPIQGYLDDINEKGKPHGLQIRMTAAGGRGISPFEMGNAVKTGVLDFVILPGNFYNRLIPVVDHQKLSEISVAEQRRNGTFDLLRKIHREQMNVYFLGRWGEGVNYHLYLNKPIKGADLTGFRIRGTPVYQAFIEALGGAMVTTPPGEAYTAIERGVVDGYGWPLWGIEAWGWDKVTKYRVEPGFYVTGIEILVNHDVWNRMTPEQRMVLEEAQLRFEDGFAEIRERNNRRAREVQEKAGIQVIELTGEEREKFLRIANEAAWEDVIKKDPVNGPKLRELITRK